MTLTELTEFFKWCSLINGGLLTYSVVMLLMFPQFVYTVHSRWFQISRESYNIIVYSFIGVFKIVFFVFNLVPYLALRLVAG